MVLDSILPVLAELIKDPIKNYIVIPIKRHISYGFKCDSTVGKLKELTEQLANKRVRLQQSVVEAERNVEHIYENVTNWLNSAETEIQKAEQLIQSKEEAKKKCFVGLCPNLKTRYQLSKKADKKAVAIEELLNENELYPISFRQAPQQIVEPSVYSREALPSRVLMLSQVMDALKDPNLHMIGVYGMGGIGKTTLAKEVQRKAVEDKLFDYVVMVDVSQTPDLRRIQGEIADFLGTKFDVEELPARASRLHEKLKNSKVLIILDDIWGKLGLRSVGIPFGDEGIGCKILLTSRSKDVLCREMGTQKEFSLEVLPEEEAWRLFETTVAEAKNAKFQTVATEVAKKCAGLPLLILMVAADLRNKELYAWKDMVEQLSEFSNEEIYERVHRVLKSSYENLIGKELKSFFLLCALYGRSNIQIRDLIRYSMGLGLLKDMRTIEDARNRVFRWISKLIDESLLLDDMVGYVKMHDVVRETALLIACGDQNAFVGRSDVRLREWPGKDCSRISLPYCDIYDLSQGLECPEADLFLLYTKDFSLKIPDLFFEGIRKLKVMGFTGIHFAGQLPSSLSFLTNLQTLCLEGCHLDDIAIIGEMKQLECLSFARSDIVELPREIEQLSQLKLLDLSMCREVEVIPANVLSKLSLLEELYMGYSFVGWDEEGKASVMELDELYHLTTLEIEVKDVKKIPNRLFSKGLLRYRILLGGDRYCGIYETSSTTLNLRLQTNIQMEHGLKELLRGTETLYLNEVRGIENWLYDIDGEGCRQLKHLLIADDNVIRHIIKYSMWDLCCAFPVLEWLHLLNLNSLEVICYGQLATGSFSKLRNLYISKCNKLRNLLSYSFAKCLPQIQEMEVEDCANMEAIIGEENEDEVIEFTQLFSLKLTGLPRLRSIFGEKVTYPNLQIMNFFGMENLEYIWQTSQLTTDSFCKLKSLTISSCRNLLAVFSSNVVKRFQRLEHLFISNCPKIQEIYQLGELIFNEVTTFELRLLRISFMKSLKRIWSSEDGDGDGDGLFSFQNLKSVEAYRCDVMEYVFPASIARNLLQLEKLDMEDCWKVEHIIGKVKGVEDKPFKFDFPELNFLRLVRLSAFKSFNAGIHVSEWPMLKYLEVVCCNEAVKLLDQVSPNLETLILEGRDLKAIPIDRFSRLKKIEVHYFRHGDGGFLFGFLRRLHYLEILVLNSDSWEEQFSVCSLEEQFLFDDERATILALKCLELRNLGNLKHFWMLHSPRCVLQYLQTLNVEYCGNLKNIATSSVSFHNLITIDVESCNKLENLVTLSTAKTMVQLMELRIRNCNMMTNIVSKDGDDAEHEIVFSQLKYLELHNLPSLNSFYSGNCTFHFPLLEKVIVNQCLQMKFFSGGISSTPKLRGIQWEYTREVLWDGNLNATIASQITKWVGINFEPRLFPNVKSLEVEKSPSSSTTIPANQLRFLNNLTKINVKDCDSVQVVFDLEEASVEDRDARLLPQLEELELINLPKLSQLWNKDPVGILDFSHLKLLKVENCSSLKYTFTPSMVSCLIQLQVIQIENCKMMEAIIKQEEADQDRIIAKMKLPSLKSVALNWLPKFSGIYLGIGILECPLLKEMTIVDCPSMKEFISSPSRGQIPTAHDEGIRGQILGMPKLHQVSPNLEKLIVDGKTLKALRCNQSPNKGFTRLKVIELHYSSDEDCGFLGKFYSLEKLVLKFCFMEELYLSNDARAVRDGKHVTEIHTLQHLELDYLPNLKHIWKEDSHILQYLQTLEVESCNSLKNIARSSVSFQNLTTLHVSGCKKLENLVTPSTAKTMVQLIELRITFCEMIKEIVANDGDDAEHETIFNQLKCLELRNLPILYNFCSGNYVFHFPSLEEVIVENCMGMKIFCGGILSTPKLQGVRHKKYVEVAQYWEGNLNATIASQCFREMVLRDSYQYDMIKDPSSSKAMLANELQLLNNLTHIKVRDCDAVQVLFDLEEIPVEDGDARLLPQLTRLDLINLPMLSQLWNKNPIGILNFSYLRWLMVENCNNLKYAFTSSMASCLIQLEEIQIENCKMMEAIIKQDEAEESISVAKPILRSLQSLALKFLPKLLSIGFGILECASLKKISIKDCPSMKEFMSTMSRETIPTIDDEGREQILCMQELHGITTSDLEELSIEWELIKDKLNGVNQREFLSRFKVVELSGFQGECAFFPSKSFLNMEALILSDSLVEEIVIQESLPWLRKVKLSNLPKLEYIVDIDHHPETISVIQNQEELQVWECSKLKILVPSSVFFQNLTFLQVSKCDGLINLITASTAKSLGQLKKLSVNKCKMMQEIIAYESNIEEDEICFTEIENLELYNLPCLISFCSSNCALDFPCLDDVYVVNCSNMKMFAQGELSTPKLSHVRTGDWEWEGSLNKTIQALSMGRIAEEIDA